MGQWLSLFSGESNNSHDDAEGAAEDEPCPACYDVDDAPSCKEAADFVQDYVYDDSALVRRIMKLLETNDSLKEKDRMIATFRDKQVMVDATRQRLVVNDYKKPDTFMVKSGEMCMTNNDKKVSFYPCNMTRRQLWRQNEEGQTVSAQDGQCFDAGMRMVPCESSAAVGDYLKVSMTDEPDRKVWRGLREYFNDISHRKAIRVKDYGIAEPVHTHYKKDELWGFVAYPEVKNFAPYCEKEDELLQVLASSRRRYRCVKNIDVSLRAKMNESPDASNVAVHHARAADPKAYATSWCGDATPGHDIRATNCAKAAPGWFVGNSKFEPNPRKRTKEEYDAEVVAFVEADAALAHNRSVARKRWERDYKKAGIGDFELWWNCYFKNKIADPEDFPDSSDFSDKSLRSRFYSKAPKCAAVTKHLDDEVPAPKKNRFHGVMIF